MLSQFIIIILVIIHYLDPSIYNINTKLYKTYTQKHPQKQPSQNTHIPPTQHNQKITMKTRKDFPTTLKYKYYILGHQFPQYFKQSKKQIQIPKQKKQPILQYSNIDRNINIEQSQSKSHLLTQSKFLQEKSQFGGNILGNLQLSSVVNYSRNQQDQSIQQMVREMGRGSEIHGPKVEFSKISDQKKKAESQIRKIQPIMEGSQKQSSENMSPNNNNKIDYNNISTQSNKMKNMILQQQIPEQPKKSVTHSQQYLPQLQPVNVHNKSNSSMSSFSLQSKSKASQGGGQSKLNTKDKPKQLSIFKEDTESKKALSGLSIRASSKQVSKQQAGKLISNNINKDSNKDNDSIAINNNNSVNYSVNNIQQDSDSDEASRKRRQQKINKSRGRINLNQSFVKNNPLKLDKPSPSPTSLLTTINTSPQFPPNTNKPATSLLSQKQSTQKTIQIKDIRQSQINSNISDFVFTSNIDSHIQSHKTKVQSHINQMIKQQQEVETVENQKFNKVVQASSGLAVGNSKAQQQKQVNIQGEMQGRLNIVYGSTKVPKQSQEQPQTKQFPKSNLNELEQYQNHNIYDEDDVQIQIDQFNRTFIQQNQVSQQAEERQSEKYSKQKFVLKLQDEQHNVECEEKGEVTNEQQQNQNVNRNRDCNYNRYQGQQGQKQEQDIQIQIKQQNSENINDSYLSSQQQPSDNRQEQQDHSKLMNQNVVATQLQEHQPQNLILVQQECADKQAKFNNQQHQQQSMQQPRPTRFDDCNQQKNGVNDDDLNIGTEQAPISKNTHENIQNDMSTHTNMPNQNIDSSININMTVVDDIQATKTKQQGKARSSDSGSLSGSRSNSHSSRPIKETQQSYTIKNNQFYISDRQVRQRSTNNGNNSKLLYKSKKAYIQKNQEQADSNGEIGIGRDHDEDKLQGQEQNKNGSTNRKADGEVQFNKGVKKGEESNADLVSRFLKEYQSKFKREWLHSQIQHSSSNGVQNYNTGPAEMKKDSTVVESINYVTIDEQNIQQKIEDPQQQQQHQTDLIHNKYEQINNSKNKVYPNIDSHMDNPKIQGVNKTDPNDHSYTDLYSKLNLCFSQIEQLQNKIVYMQNNTAQIVSQNEQLKQLIRHNHEQNQNRENKSMEKHVELANSRGGTLNQNQKIQKLQQKLKLLEMTTSGIKQQILELGDNIYKQLYHNNSNDNNKQHPIPMKRKFSK